MSSNPRQKKYDKLKAKRAATKITHLNRDHRIPGSSLPITKQRRIVKRHGLKASA